MRWWIRVSPLRRTSLSCCGMIEGLVCFSHEKGWRERLKRHSPFPYFRYPFPSPPAPTATLSVICFPQLVHYSSRQASFPGVLRRVPSVTERHLATTTP